MLSLMYSITRVTRLSKHHLFTTLLYSIYSVNFSIFTYTVLLLYRTNFYRLTIIAIFFSVLYIPLLYISTSMYTLHSRSLSYLSLFLLQTVEINPHFRATIPKMYLKSYVLKLGWNVPFFWKQQYAPSYWCPYIDHSSKDCLTKLSTTHPIVRHGSWFSSFWTDIGGTQTSMFRRWWWRRVGDVAWRDSDTTKSPPKSVDRWKNCVQNRAEYIKKNYFTSFEK